MSAVFTLSRRLKAGEQITLAWVGNPDPLTAEAIARTRFGAINLDMQHGLHDPVSIMQSIGAVVSVGKPAVVRIPVGDFAMASRALDMGANAVIAPMINTVADARAFADAMKYPPLGKRSWGPTRVMALSGETDAQRYLQAANGETLALAMIETRQALDNLEAILAVDGIDGVFVGPSDLSLTLSDGAYVDANAALIAEPLARIAAVTLQAGKIPAAFAMAPERTRAMFDLGYRLVTVGTDSLYLAQGANALVDAV